jgi:hypothetical protein
MLVAPGMQIESWAPKMCASIRHFALLAGAAALVAIGTGCSLNPQPLPPGDTQGDAGNLAALDATAGGGADTGVFVASDGGSADGSTPAIPPADGGADAEADTAVDGPSDAAADGQPPSDGATEE